MARSGAGEEVPFIQSLSLQWVQALASCGVGALWGGAGVGCGAGKSRVRKQDEDSEQRCWVRTLGADEGEAMIGGRRKLGRILASRLAIHKH